MLIYIGIGTSAVTEVRDVVNSGYLEGVVYNKETKQYTVNGEEVTTYPKYRYGVAFGEDNKFMYALDGFSFTDTAGIGRKTFIYEYGWTGSEEFNSREIVDYIDHNYWKMVLRIVAYSNQLVVAIILFLGLMLINKWLLPIGANLLVSMFGLMMALRGMILKEEESNRVRVYEARLLRETVEEYERNKLYIWVIGFIAFSVSLYSVRFHENSAIYVALWVNVTFIIFYILRIITGKHINIVKINRKKGED